MYCNQTCFSLNILIFIRYENRPVMLINNKYDCYVLVFFFCSFCLSFIKAKPHTHTHHNLHNEHLPPIVWSKRPSSFLWLILGIRSTDRHIKELSLNWTQSITLLFDLSRLSTCRSIRWFTLQGCSPSYLSQLLSLCYSTQS